MHGIFHRDESRHFFFSSLPFPPETGELTQTRAINLKSSTATSISSHCTGQFFPQNIHDKAMPASLHFTSPSSLPLFPPHGSSHPQHENTSSLPSSPEVTLLPPLFRTNTSIHTNPSKRPISKLVPPPLQTKTRQKRHTRKRDKSRSEERTRETSRGREREVEFLFLLSSAQVGVEGHEHCSDVHAWREREREREGHGEGERDVHTMPYHITFPSNKTFHLHGRKHLPKTTSGEIMEPITRKSECSTSSSSNMDILSSGKPPFSLPSPLTLFKPSSQRKPHSPIARAGKMCRKSMVRSDLFKTLSRSLSSEMFLTRKPTNTGKKKKRQS